MVHDDAPVERQTYTVREVAKVLGIGRDSAYELVQQHRIRALKLRQKIVIPRREVERILSGEGLEAAA